MSMEKEGNQLRLALNACSSAAMGVAWVAGQLHPWLTLVLQVIKVLDCIGGWIKAFKYADEEVKQMASRIPLMTAILTNLTQIRGWEETLEEPIRQFAENLQASCEAIERYQNSIFGWGATATNKKLKSLASHQDRLMITINCWILTGQWVAANRWNYRYWIFMFRSRFWQVARHPGFIMVCAFLVSAACAGLCSQLVIYLVQAGGGGLYNSGVIPHFCIALPILSQVLSSPLRGFLSMLCSAFLLSAALAGLCSLLEIYLVQAGIRILILELEGVTQHTCSNDGTEVGGIPFPQRDLLPQFVVVVDDRFQCAGFQQGKQMANIFVAVGTELRVAKGSKLNE
eukprot:g79608.t1